MRLFIPLEKCNSNKIIYYVYYSWAFYPITASPYLCIDGSHPNRYQDLNYLGIFFLKFTLTNVYLHLKMIWHSVMMNGYRSCLFGQTI